MALDAFEPLLRRDRVVVIVALAVVIVAAWIFLLLGAGTRMYPHEMAVLVPEGMGIVGADFETPTHAGIAAEMASPTPWTPAYALLMFWMWWLMMVAMMLPSAAPMVLLHATVTRNSVAQQGTVAAGSPPDGSRDSTASFLAGYLLMWGAFSLAAVAAQWALQRWGLLSEMMMPTSRILASALLMAAGLWQLTPLKSRCLRHCRSPAGYFSAHWRPGVGGAFRMGALHGLFCLACCWFLMALLFFGGVMNLVWIIGLALLVLAEKILPAGLMIGRIAGLLLLVWGVWLAVTVLQAG